MIELNGMDLTLTEVSRVSRANNPACLSKDARTAIERSRATVEQMLSSGAAIYGLTTGFGKFAEKFRSAAYSVALRGWRRQILSRNECFRQFHTVATSAGI